MSPLNDFRARLAAEHFAFAETLAFVAEHYDYQPSACLLYTSPSPRD